MSSAKTLCVISIVVVLLASGCATPPRQPVPIDQIYEAQVIGFPNVRAWAGEVSELFQRDMVESVEAEQRRGIDVSRDKDGAPLYSVLALSGGGSHGAFGAGFLAGWTKSGKRPSFKLVSGISTGALIAPFAFLGSDYDELLKKLYTTTSTEQIGKFVGVLNIFATEALANTDALKTLLQEIVSPQIIRDVARAHDQGRRLYIGTTHMDAQRLIVWNMGLIAKSSHPGKQQLFRDVMLASASIPGAFPPVLVEVEANGRIYDEMHADGGTLTQVFFYAGTLDLQRAGRVAGFNLKKWPVGNLYVIRNGQLAPTPKQMKRKLVDISARAVDTLVKASARSDLYRIYAFAQREKVNFFYVEIPDAFEFTPKEIFDPEEMKLLYKLGHEMGQKQEGWKTVPPGFTPAVVR
jgi:hypothetical protein